MKLWKRLDPLVSRVLVVLWFLGSALWIGMTAAAEGEDGARFLGLPPTVLELSGAVVASIAVGLLGIDTYYEKRRVERLLDPRHLKIRRLKAAIDPIGQFFERRDCKGHESECASVLALYMLDARESGLFDAPEFIDERVALRRGETPLHNYGHVLSMMRYKRGLSEPYDPMRELGTFQRWLIEAIEREIELEESAI